MNKLSRPKLIENSPFQISNSTNYQVIFTHIKILSMENHNNNLTPIDLAAFIQDLKYEITTIATE